MSKIKVLLLSHSLSLSGAPKVILDAFEEMSDEITLCTVSLAGGPLRDRCAGLGALKVLPYLPKGGSLPRKALRSLAAMSLRKISAQIRAWQPDVIYANTVGALPIARLLDLPRVPVILHVHELDSVIREHTEGCEGLLEKWPATYIADSEAVRDNLAKTYCIPRENISLVYEFVPEAVLRSLPAKKPKAAHQPFVVGSAGFPNWRKGPLLWLQMAAELRKMMGDKVRFVWVGVLDNSDGFVFQEIVKKLDLSACVDLVPVTSDPWKYFVDFDVFTVTSWEEPFSIVMAENMALGTPGLCFAGCGGTPEVIGDTGIVLPDFSPYGMAQAIAALAKSPEKLETLGAAARARVLSNFSSSHQVPTIRSVVRSVYNKAA